MAGTGRRPHAAAAEPRELGHGRRDERGAPVRGQRAAGGGAARAAARAGDRRDRRDRQEKAGAATAGVERQYLGCAGRVANGITTVHLSYVREKAGHALIGARQRIPREHLADPVKSLLMGLPLDLGFRTRGQLAIGISTDAAADGIRPDFYCRDEVYGSCTQLREHFEAESQAYVLRVPSNFTLTVAAGAKMTCAQAVTALLRHPRRREIRSAGSGSKGERWYAWAWIATASPGHHLLVRRPAEGPHRHPGAAPGPARSAATRRARHDPADHPRAQAAARRPHHPAPAPMACHPLGCMDPPPPGPLAMVPQTRQARP
jgi:hypothetical protein